MTVTASAEAVVDLAAQLVRTDSVNPALVPGAAGETEIVDLLARRLTSGGFSVEVLPAAAARRPSLLATHAGTGGGPSLLLNGHLDTVGVAGMPEPFAARIVGERRSGRLLGRGACDMKGAVAAMVTAAEAAAATGTAGDLLLALVADEEHASLGTEAILARLTRLPDACLIGEPTSLDLAVAHRGYAVVDVALTGDAAHSSQPALGVNAVTHLGRLLAAVEARHVDLLAGPPHPVAGTGSLMATVARGGTSPFVLAEAASTLIERRTVPGEPAAEGLRDVERILATMRRDDPSVRAAASLSLAREAWQYNDASPAAAALTDALADALTIRRGRRPNRVAAPFWLEAALYETAGIPTVVCGPAGGGPHAIDEWLDLTQLHAYTEALTDTLRNFCGRGPG